MPVGRLLSDKSTCDAQKFFRFQITLSIKYVNKHLFTEELFDFQMLEME